MNRRAATCTAILSSILFASTAFAGSEINKCVAPSGAVTLTDEACPSNTLSIKLVAATSAPETAETPPPHAGPRMPTVERFTSAPMPLRFATRMRSPAPARAMTLDVATLKAAKANLHLFDMASPRSQRLAGLP